MKRCQILGWQNYELLNMTHNVAEKQYFFVFQAILMDTNCSMKTRSYSTQETHNQAENMDQIYDEYD